MLNRPNSNKRRPQFLCIIGCEGHNQERMYFDKVAELVNCIEERTHDLVFDYAEPYGGDPKCVVERTIEKSIGKENKVSVFDYDGKKEKYEEAIDLAKENKIELGYSNYSFDLWLILHKEDYFEVVQNQNDYADKLRQVYGFSADTKIKKQEIVRKMMDQIELSDIKIAIQRGKKISKDNQDKVQNKTPEGNGYYNNPDTQMHILLQFLFAKIGIKIE